MEIYAHSTEGPKETWQTLAEHLEQTAALCARFAEKFGAGPWAALAGWLHDIGKVSPAFQQRLEGGKKRVDHSTAGGQAAFALLGHLSDFAASLAAYAVLGHHGGLPDGRYAQHTGGQDLHSRRCRSLPDYSRWSELVPFKMPDIKALPRQISAAPENEQGFAAAFFVRMLFSCLTDADWLDTERFCSPGRFARRPAPPALADLAEAFFSFTQKQLRANCTGNAALQALRQEIQELCRAAAAQPPGCFALTVPTGGGKTFSSLAFALEHARLKGLDRVIYVIPFTSIIEQNAAEFRRALGPLGATAVLEHHSAVSAETLSSSAPEGAGENADDLADAGRATDMRLAAENWDASLIVTTAVQFFESLFARQPAKCRKLHNIANSVIILDEAQMLPPELLNPCVMALRELIRGYKATVVLCTATQPALFKTKDLSAGFARQKVTDIIPPDRQGKIFAAFKRVNLSYAGSLADDQVAEKMLAQPQALAIVNTRARAAALYQSLGRDEAHFHLSALMYPEHRRRKLTEIRRRLQAGLACRVVSTSLIEAGVDIDFPLVLREETGLDSVAQAAGRCNREAKLPHKGQVIVFTPLAGLPAAPFFSRRASAAAWTREQPEYEDLLGPAAMAAYFNRLYKVEGPKGLDRHGILKTLDEAICDDDLRDAPAFAFAEVAAKFRFIADDTVPVIVETEEALALLQQLEKTEDRQESRDLLRRLQSYAIPVYANVLPQLALRQMPRYGLHILSGATGYCDDLGLKLDNPHFREAQKNIF